MAWTRSQQMVVALLPKFSSILSMLGSLWIMIEVITDDNPNRPKRNHPYHRLLFAMSLYDVLEGVWNFGSSWPIPEGTENILWARGTTGTCSAQGFFLQFSVAVPIYNAMLSVYYVLVINYKYKDEALRKWVEPSMHAIAFIWAFGTATYSAVTGLLNNANLWCWIAPFPLTCLDTRRYGDEGNCIRGDNAWIYRWAFYFAPLWFCIFTATVCTLMVYFYVQSIDKSSAQYRNPERFSYLNTQVPSKPLRLNSVQGESTVETSRRSVTFAESGEFPESNVEKKEGVEEPTVEANANQLGDVLNEDDSGSEIGMPPIPEQGPVDRSGKSSNTSLDDDEIERLRRGTGGDETSERSRAFTRATNTRKSLRDVVGKWQSSRMRYKEDYRRTLEVYHQALFYVGTFYLTHVWSTSNRILQFVNGGNSVFALTAIHSFFDPLQGFLNYFVYQRPRYLRIRKEYPNAGRMKALIRMLRFSDLPDPSEWADSESTRRGVGYGASSGYRATSSGYRNNSTSGYRGSVEASNELSKDFNITDGKSMTFAGVENLNTSRS